MNCFARARFIPFEEMNNEATWLVEFRLAFFFVQTVLTAAYRKRHIEMPFAVLGTAFRTIACGALLDPCPFFIYFKTSVDIRDIAG